MRDLLIIGTGNTAVLAADVASEIAEVNTVGFVESIDPARCKKEFEGLPVLWIEDLAEKASDHLVVCAMPNRMQRPLVERLASSGIEYATLVHPSATLSPTCRVAEGIVVCAQAVISAHTRIGRHSFLNRGVLVGHHTVVAPYSTLMPGCNVAGFCEIGDEALIGMGALVRDHTAVGSGAVVGMGAVVVRPVPESVTVLGNPARAVARKAAPEAAAPGGDGVPAEEGG